MKNKKTLLLCLCCITVLIAASAALIYINHNKETDETMNQQKQTIEKDATDSSENDVNEDESENMEPTTITFTGDVLLSNYVLRNYDSKGIRGVLDDGLLELLNNSNITMINNEFPYSTRGTQAPDKQYTFRVNPSYVSVIQEMGVDIAGLANNHVLDFGKEALEDTFTTLDGAGIEYTGAGESVEDASKLIVKEYNGKKFGFLAASRVIPVGSWNVENSQPGVFTTYDPTKLIAEIKEAKKTCDYVYVSVHWGVEHTDELTDYQESMAHQFVDAGADGVIGAHPHVLQGMEYYNGKPIFYSLGNFIFNETINRTMAVQFVVDEENQVSIQLIPASAENAYTHEVTQDTAESIYSYLESISPTVTIDENGYLQEVE